jgi:hypothetical protein
MPIADNHCTVRLGNHSRRIIRVVIDHQNIEFSPG